MKKHWFFLLVVVVFGAWGTTVQATPAGEPSFTMKQILGYPYPANLVASKKGNRIAWTLDERGRRSVWVAAAPDFTPQELAHYTRDDGQELTQLEFSPDGKYLVYVRGGDHDANWSQALPPDPDSSPAKPAITIWAIALPDGKPVKVAQGDHPAISAENRLAYINKDGEVWTAALDGHGKASRLFFDRGNDGSLHWSPDGSRLAFVSDRGDHAFIGIFTAKEQPLQYLAPSTRRDFSPRWSPDGQRIAFVRIPGKGGAPRPILKLTPTPWAIWVADVASGKAHAVWAGPDTLPGSLPDTAGGANLHWAAGGRLVFLADLDGWPHLYSIESTGGKPLRLTSGDFMVEDVVESPNRRFIVYNANTGKTAGDVDRRHLYRVPVDA